MANKDAEDLINYKENKQQLEHQEKWFNSHYSKFNKYKLENWRISTLSRLFSNLHINKRNKSSDSFYLDIGVGGSGYTVIEAARLGQKSVGIDISFEGIKKAREFAINEKLHANCFFLVCTADALPFKAEIFDKVSALSVLEHLHNDVNCIKDIYRITRKKGIVSVTVPNTYYRMWPFLWPVYYYIDKNIGHLRHYSEEKLKRLFTKEKFVLKSTLYNGHLVKVVQLLFEKIIGSNRFPDSLWWKMESVDLNSKSKTGLQLTAIFTKE